MDQKKKVVPFSIKKADNLAVILFFATFIPFGIINIIDKRTPLLATGSVWWDSLVTLAVYVAGMAMHEGLHALTALAVGKVKPSDVKFGLDLKNGNLYTHFKTPMKARAYAGALIVPCIVTGLAPMALITAWGAPILLGSACLLFAGCAGDILMFVALLKEDKNILVADHPYALAYYVVYPENSFPEDFVELTEEEERAALKDSVVQKSGDDKAIKRSLLLKCFGILVFIALYVLAMYLISLLMKII